MTGPRRPPTGRAGTATLAGRAAAGSGRPAPSGRGGAKTGAKAPGGPKSVKTNRVKTDRAGTAGAKASGRKSTTQQRSADRANTRAMARVDGPRGRRDGIGEQDRRRKVRRRARIMVGVAVTVLLVGVLFVAVLPTSNFLEQRSETDRLEAELSEMEAERAAIGAEIDRLETDSEIEAQARRNGYVQPGEEAYNVLPTPIDPIGLPEVWPFTGVEEAMGVR